jgi:hypothetical protein
MHDEQVQRPSATPSTDAAPKTTARGTHPYHAPTLTNFGSLVELVQRNPGRGGDGGAADCSLT